MTVRILVGHVLDRLAELPDESVQCVVTSPPYFGLRDYKIEPQVWGGAPGCSHEWTDASWRATRWGSHDDDKPGDKQKRNVGSLRHGGKGEASTCAICGAWRGSLGLEPTVDLYVEHIVEVFRAVRRVLRADGTLWLNLGDSYAWGAQSRRVTESDDPTWHSSQINNHPKRASHIGAMRGAGVKPKDLYGVPWMVAFALRGDGWWLRQDIIWCLSGGAWVYARTRKGDMPIMVKDLVRLDPRAVKLWNGEKWTQVMGWGPTPDATERLELVLRSGERIGCTGGHVWPTQRGNIAGRDLTAGDVIATCRLPEPTPQETNTWPQYLNAGALWLCGLFLAEGNKRSSGAITFALSADEIPFFERIKVIAENYGGSASATVSGGELNVRVWGRVLHAIIDTYIGGSTAIDKHLKVAVWRLRNEALQYIIEGYLDGDGHHDEPNRRWRLGFCRNYALERDLRTAAARLGATVTLKPGVAGYQGGEQPNFRGEWRWERSGHWNEKDRGEIVEIRNSRARQFWDIGVEDEPHLFALASGVLTHNSKPNPMPESVTDRCTKTHEYLFMLSKSERYYYDQDAVLEPCSPATHARSGIKNNDSMDAALAIMPSHRNRRSVWTVAAQPYSEHFATFPPALVEPCVLAGSRRGDLVLDPFGGAGTTALVADRLQRHSILIELNPDYAETARRRIDGGAPLFADIAAD